MIVVGHQALNGIPPAFPKGSDIDDGPNLIALAGFFEEITQIKVLNQEIGGYLWR